MTNYYVYYKVDGVDLNALRLSVQNLFKTIESKTGIRGRWMRRRDDPSTYMEVYEGVNDTAGFESVLERSGSGFAVPRRLEIFRMADLTD